jgi:hypothetical protein
LLRKTQIHFFFLGAQTAQIEEFMFQNVACTPTVYRTGGVKKNKKVSGPNEIGNHFSYFYEEIKNAKKNDLSWPKYNLNPRFGIILLYNI